MLTQSITDIKAEAAGTISAAKKPTKWDDKKHPLATWIQGDKDVRECIINSPKVCGIGFITPNNRFRLLQGVASWGDLTDPAMKMMVIGHVGAKTQNPKPSALPLAAVTREFQQIRKKVDEEGEPPSWFKMGKNNIRDWTPKTGDPNIDLPADTEDWRIVAYPVAATQKISSVSEKLVYRVRGSGVDNRNVPGTSLSAYASRSGSS